MVLLLSLSLLEGPDAAADVAVAGLLLLLLLLLPASYSCWLLLVCGAMASTCSVSRCLSSVVVVGRYSRKGGRLVVSSAVRGRIIKRGV